MPTETKKHSGSSSDVCEQVCRIHGHHIVIFQKETNGEVLICSACGLTIFEIRSGEQV